MRSFVSSYILLILIFVGVTITLFNGDRTDTAPLVVGVSYHGGSYCARFPILGQDRCSEFGVLPLAQWPLRSNLVRSKW